MDSTQCIKDGLPDVHGPLMEQGVSCFIGYYKRLQEKQDPLLMNKALRCAGI